MPRNMISSICMATSFTSLKELGVEEERLEEMAEKCTNMGKRTLPGIRELGKEEMMEIYRMAMGE